MDAQALAPLVARLRSASFPEGSEVEELDDLHGDLALADSDVADLAIPAAEGDTAVGAVADSTRDILRDVVSRAAAFSDPDTAEMETAALYREYAELLLAIVAALDSPDPSPAP